MKGKNIVITALAVTLLTACKDKTYKPPTLDAMRSADKAKSCLGERGRRTSCNRGNTNKQNGFHCKR